MPWLSRKRYHSLLRAAGERVEGMGRDVNTFGMNNTGVLVARVIPHRLQDNIPIKYPFEFIHVEDVETKVVIFVVINGQGIMFEDDHDMFPTDELVAKLRLLMK